MAVRNFYWLFEGALAGSGRPGAGREWGREWPAGEPPQSLDDDLDWLAAQGIGAILSLTETPLPARALQAHGMVGLSLPIDDETAPTQSQLLAALEFIDAQQAQGRAVLTHCHIGEGRTGCVLAAYLIRAGATPEQALARLRALRPGAVGQPAQERALATFAATRLWIV